MSKANDSTAGAAGDAPPPPPPPNAGTGQEPVAGLTNDDAPKDQGEPGKPNSRAKGAVVDDKSDTSVAKGAGTDALGEQVHPDTQTSEKDGHRTLMRPVTDPGPVYREGAPQMRHPDRSKGEHRYSDANEPVEVQMRTSTGHSHGFASGVRTDDGERGSTLGTRKLPPEVAANHAASDVYNKEQGAGLTDRAKERALEPKELARVHE